MTPEKMALRNAVADALLVNDYVSAPTSARRAADLVLRVLDGASTGPNTPQLCGRRHITDGGPQYACTLPADHRSEFHMDIDRRATWSRAGDLEVHDRIEHAHDRITARPAALERATPMPLDATLRSALDGIGRQLSGMRDVFGELLNATCTGCRPVALSSNPEDGADLEVVPGCPVHGETAELRRALDWSARQHERIALALGPEYAGPFAPDIAAAAEACIKTARGLDGTLRADAGIEHPSGLRGVVALISQRDAAREHAKNAESDLAVIGQAARLVLADLSGDATALTSALTNIAAIVERRSR